MVQDRRGRPSREILLAAADPSTGTSASGIGYVQVEHTLFGHNEEQFHWNSSEHWRSGYFIWRMNLALHQYIRLSYALWGNGGSGQLDLVYLTSISVEDGYIITTSEPLGVSTVIPSSAGVYATDWVPIAAAAKSATTTNSQGAGVESAGPGDLYLCLTGTDVDARFGRLAVQLRPDYTTVTP